MAEQAFIDRTSNPTEKLEVLIFSNKEPSKNVDLSAGTIQFNYYESLFSDTIKADLHSLTVEILSIMYQSIRDFLWLELKGWKWS